MALVDARQAERQHVRRRLGGTSRWPASPVAAPPAPATVRCRASRTSCRVADVRARRSRAIRRWRRASASASNTSSSTGSASWCPACVNRGTSSSAAVVRPNCFSNAVNPCSAASSAHASGQQRVVPQQIRTGYVHHGHGRDGRSHLSLDAGVVARRKATRMPPAQRQHLQPAVGIGHQTAARLPTATRRRTGPSRVATSAAPSPSTATPTLPAARRPLAHPGHRRGCRQRIDGRGRPCARSARFAR